MLKKIFKTIWKIVIILLLLLFFFSVIRPAYLNYKANKKEVVVDTSGERATSKNKVSNSETSTTSEDDGNTWKLERKEEYEPVNFDDRILLYEGTQNGTYVERLFDVLIEDIDSQTYSKIDVNFNGVDISYDNKENYASSLNKFKNAVSSDGKYLVEFEYGTLNAVVNKVIITNQ